MKILIAMMKHETNTFSPVVTEWARFEDWGGPYLDDDVISAYSTTRMPTAAFLKIARDHHAEIVTPLAAESMPSGMVTAETYRRMTEIILESIRSHPDLDCVLLELHGAMVVETSDDGEGDLLARVREIRPNLPIAVSCDFHGNISDLMVQNCTCICGYNTYPHVDVYETAETAAKIVLDAVEGKSVPKMSFGRLPLLSHTLCQDTDDEPMKSLIALCREAETRPGVLAVSIFGGFLLSDVRDAGVSVVVVTDEKVAHEGLGREVLESMLNEIWASREQHVYQHRPLDEAIAEAKRLSESSSHPIMLVDHADNCGSGASQDSMFVIEKLLEAGFEDVVVFGILDPEAVRRMQEVGVGGSIGLDLGGKTDMPSVGLVGAPLRVSGTVRALTDGRWVIKVATYTGCQIDTGPSAVLDIGPMQIVVVSRSHEPWDPQVFTTMEIEPSEHKFVLLKSRITFRAGFSTICPNTVYLDGEGCTTSDYSVLKYEKLRRPIYPLDPDCEWSPEEAAEG